MMDAEENGWNLENGRYTIKWLDCSQLPPTIIDIISNAQTELDDSDEDPPFAQAASYSSDEYSDADDYD